MLFRQRRPLNLKEALNLATKVVLIALRPGTLQNKVPGQACLGPTWPLDLSPGGYSEETIAITVDHRDHHNHHCRHHHHDHNGHHDQHDCYTHYYDHDNNNNCNDKE